MSLSVDELLAAAEGFPRSRGDEPSFCCFMILLGVFSPLTRG